MNVCVRGSAGSLVGTFLPWDSWGELLAPLTVHLWPFLSSPKLSFLAQHERFLLVLASPPWTPVGLPEAWSPCLGPVHVTGTPL